jgi:hypothetical protein
MRRAPHEGLQAAPLAAEGNQRVVPTVTAAQAQEEADRARDEGRAMTLDEAFDYAPAGLPPADD